MITKMNELELASTITGAMQHKLDLAAVERLAESYYMREPRGDEESGYSDFISSQVADLIDSDLPSLARIFLGAGKIVEFVPNSDDEADIQEADQKTEYTTNEITQAKGYYRVMHDALMRALQHPLSVVRYSYTQDEQTRIKVHNFVLAEEMAALQYEYSQTYDNAELFDIELLDDDEHYSCKFMITSTQSRLELRTIPLCDFIISEEATGKHDARIIGEKVKTRRGQLLAAGYKKELIDMADACSEGYVQDWASQEVEGFDGFMRIDYNGDGIAELRKVVMYGGEIFENEQLDDDERAIEFALGNCSLLPNSLTGVSRTDRAASYQDTMTTITRAMLDNTAQITRGRLIVNTSNDIGLNFHDVIGDGSIIRANPMTGMTLSEAAFPLPIQSVATEALTVIQYLDASRAQSSGSLMANQDLKADVLQKETATRFRGIDDSSKAKIELITRNIAETLIRQLYEGVCYMAAIYGEPKGEINPAMWSLEHRLVASVGAGHGDPERAIEVLGGVLSLAQTFAGSQLFDEKKIYNTIAQTMKLSGIYNIADYMNDPEMPQQTMQAQIEQLTQQLQQATEALKANDPLIQVEMVKAQAKLEEQQMKLEMESMKLELEKYKAISANALRLTELEVTANKNLNAQYTNNEGEML